MKSATKLSELRTLDACPKGAQAPILPIIQISSTSPILSPKMLQLTPVRPPLSTSIDKHAHALHKTILEGRFTQLKYFLEMGLNPNCVDRQINKRSCLMLAPLTDQIDYGIKVARLLLKHGADINAQDTFGRTVAFMACSHGREKLFELLLNDENSLGVDFGLKDNDGNILLNHVCAHGSPRMVEIVAKCMVKRGIECDQRNHSGFTAILLAIKNDRFLNALTLMKTCPTVSVSIRDREKCLNAIEWLGIRIGIHAQQNSIKVYQQEQADANPSSAHTNRTIKASNSVTPDGRSQLNASSVSRWKTNSSSDDLSRSNSSEFDTQAAHELYKLIYSRMSAKNLRKEDTKRFGKEGIEMSRPFSMLELESMRSTPKLLKLSQRRVSCNETASAKSMVHVLFGMYDDGTNRFKSQQQKVSKIVKAKKNSVANLVLRERGARNSIVSLSHRLKLRSD